MSNLKARLLRLAHHGRDLGSLPALIRKNIAFLFSAERQDQRYDSRLGIDTTGYIDLSELGIGAGAGEPLQPYVPTPPNIAKFLIQLVAPRAEGFTFVDVGSGKGRVLLIAAEFAFRRVVGFEYSQMLSEIAARNIRQFSARHRLKAPIEIVTGDATQLPLPDGPLVLYLFNPLGPNALMDFMASVKSAYQRSHRKIICIYYNAAHSTALEDTGIFPIRRLVDYPKDGCDRYGDLNFQALVYETE